VTRGPFRHSLITLLAMMAATLGIAVTSHAGQAPTTTSRASRPPAAVAVVEAGAAALGGADRIRAVRNITAHGYGVYAYHFGGSSITGAVQVPMKQIAANELRRVYDLENDRFQLIERRNWLFPFLIKAGHTWQQTNVVLDGDIAWAVENGTPRRLARWEEGTNWIDGPVMQRLWMMNNPVVLLRALLDPETQLSAPRAEGKETVIDVTLKQGYRLSAAFGEDRLPAWVRWATPHTNLGQMNFTTWFSGWADINGLMLPLGFATNNNWRDSRYFSLFVDAYDIDSNIENLAAPAAIRNTPEPQAYPPLTLTSEQVARGIWRISGGTTVVEFADHLVIYELIANVRQAKQVLDYARSLVPGKPIRYLIPSHNHFDHVRGIRQAVAEGITIITRPITAAQFAETLEGATPEYPDDYSRNPQPMKTMLLDERIRLQDATQTLDVYWMRNNGHMADGVFAHAPEQKVLMEADMVTAALDLQHWPDNFRDMLAYYKLDVEKISPVHSVVPGATVLTHEQAETLLKEGTQRAREHCAAKLAGGTYHPGCPIKSRYY
jgi:glyoxylase-like metal-dependent hydrolase (beta-lactamase superfamily II)